jgi:PAS domain S-box-containing protein
MYHLNLREIDKSSLLVKLEKSVKVPKDAILVTRIDKNSNILYYNNALAKISGYKKRELIDRPYSKLQHPDIPKAILYVIWNSLIVGKDTHAILKHISKDGNYYWLFVKYIVQKDNEDNIISFLTEGRAISKSIVKKVEPLYKKLLEEESKNGKESSIKKLQTILSKNNIASYNDFILNLIGNKRHSFFSNLKI